MLKSIKLLAVSAAIFCAAGCSTTNLTPSQIALINQIQQGAIKVCGFMPTVEGILSLVGPVIPAASGAGAVITAICAAIPPAPVAAFRGMAAAPRAGQETVVLVQGVPVKGVYTK